MRALVTGARGFVGTWLVQHLRASGDEVIGVDHEVDVTDGVAIAQAMTAAAPDAVYHLAALTHVGRSWQEPAEVFRVNTIGTLQVLEAARQCRKAPIVLLTSSAEVYGAVDPNDLPVSESAPLAPVTPYAASKVAAEYAAVHEHLAYGLPVIRVRPFNHIGPGQSAEFVVAALAQRIVAAGRAQSSSITVGNLSARRDITDVRDVVHAYRLLVQDGAPGEVYNVCSGRDVSIDEVAQRLLHLAEVTLELVADPGLMRPVDVPVVRGDPSRLRTATGWQPDYVLDRTLFDVLTYWDEHDSLK